jgi:hypothetical protein
MYSIRGAKWHLSRPRSAQRLADVLANPATASKPPARRADYSYFWNRTLAKPLLGARAGAADFLAALPLTLPARNLPFRGAALFACDNDGPCRAARGFHADAGADAFVLTMILGSVGQITGVEAKTYGR